MANLAKTKARAYSPNAKPTRVRSSKSTLDTAMNQILALWFRQKPPNNNGKATGPRNEENQTDPRAPPRGIIDIAKKTDAAELPKSIDGPLGPKSVKDVSPGHALGVH